MLEYSHLDEIRLTGSRLIEMETAAYYSCLNIMGKQGFAILLVSDNSESNKSLVEKSIEDKNRYNYVRNNDITRIISLILEL